MHALWWRGAPSLEALVGALPAQGRFWLDADPGHVEGRWAFLGARPQQARVARWGEPRPLSPFDRLGPAPRDAKASPRWTGEPPELEPWQVPWWIGYVAYDAAWSDPAAFGSKSAARLPRGGADAQPVVWLGRYDALLAVDRHLDRVYVLGPTEQGCRRYQAQLASAAAGPTGPLPPGRRGCVVGPAVAEEPALHLARIAAALEAIAAGEIYQVNLARPWTASYLGSPLPLWLAMREASPVPLGMYLELADHAVLARTMERFLRWDPTTRRLWTSPIKGTIARTGRDDAGEAAALAADDKERAEHSMIVDLMRNDLSRVAEVGSVRVHEPLRVEPFAGLSHLVSTVECRTEAHVSRAGILEATFPPGSVTGTPKLRAMRLIEDCEGTPRGIYTGALGYVDRGGGLSLAVAIRTAVVRDRTVTYFAGGGLVSASDPARELAETDRKAQVFLDALASLTEAGAAPAAR